jgi:hypothetical protein
MGWDCHGGDVSAGVLCRALRRAARAPPSIRRNVHYRISVLFARHSGSTPIRFVCHTEWSRHASANRTLNRKEPTLMRKFLLLIVAALAVVAMPSTALAAVNVKSLPTATFSGPTVTLTGGNFSGLGSVPAIATLTVQGSATYTCTNQGGNASPGQNPVPAQPGSANQDLGNADHNGRGTINDLTATATAPSPPPSTQTVGCGGGGSTQWTLTKPVVTVTGAQLVIKQGGSIVFCRNYTANGIGTAPPPACS